MAEENVKVRIEIEGAQQSARDLDRVGQGLGTVATGAAQAGRATTTATAGMADMARGGQALAQRVQGASAAVQTLVGALGSRNHTAGLVASVAGTTAQFAAMGAMLGPAGTVIGGLVGLTAGLVGVVDASSRVATAVDQAEEALRDATTQADRYAAALAAVRAESDALAGLNRANAIRAGDTTALSSEEASAEIRSREAEIARLREEYGATEDSPRVRLMREEIERLREEVRIDVEEGTIEMIAPSDPRYRTRDGRTRRGSRDDTDYGAEAIERERASMAEVAARNAAHQAEMAAEIRKRYEEEEELRLRNEERQREADEREFARAVEMNQALAQAEEERQDRIAEGRLAMKEAQEEADAQALEGRRETATEMTGLLGNVTMSFGKTLAAIATGEKSADEAFKGLAASFLEMISQYTTLKAATEFAEAGASFANYDYGGGAAHIAAGVAFTAVAVATGVGAAAINAPPQAPARPETSSDRNEGRGGDVVIVWNSPVVTAGTRAELGREMRTLVGEAASI